MVTAPDRGCPGSFSSNLPGVRTALADQLRRQVGLPRPGLSWQRLSNHADENRQWVCAVEPGGPDDYAELIERTSKTKVT